MERLSIVVPTLDEVDNIEAHLAVLQPLRRSGHEVIVADGGSADGTVALAQALADAVIVAPRGRGSQMNAGAAQAGGHALLFLHADTRGRRAAGSGWPRRQRPGLGTFRCNHRR